MNTPVITVFVELTLLTISLDYSLLVNAHNCSSIADKNDMVMNCSYLGLYINVPQDLDPGLTVLDLSGNYMINLVIGQGFDKYTHLKTLIMRDMMKPFDIQFSKSLYLFKNIYSLETIDFSRSFVEDSKIGFVWPPNIKTIYFAGNPYFKSLEVDNLKKLERLYASNITSMKEFPIFHELASLIVIDIKGDPVEDVSTDLISNHCNLEHFNFTPTANLSYCECRKLKIWMINYRIKAGSPFSCGKQNDESKCDLKFTSKEIDQRRNCFGRNAAGLTTSRWYIILPLVLIICFSLLIPSYLYAKKFRDKKHKLHHPKLPKYTPSAVELPAGEEASDEDNSSDGQP